MFLQQLINGIIIGASYALIALGLNLIWSITDIPDFSQGGIYVVTAYVAYFAVKRANFPFVVSLLMAMVIGAGMAFIIERFLYRRWTGSGRIQLLCAIALFFLLSNLAILFGYDAVTVVAKAIERANSLDPVKIRDEIAKTDWQGLEGHIKFETFGEYKNQGRYEPAFIKWEGSDRVAQ